MGDDNGGTEVSVDCDNGGCLLFIGSVCVSLGARVLWGVAAGWFVFGGCCLAVGIVKFIRMGR